MTNLYATLPQRSRRWLLSLLPEVLVCTLGLLGCQSGGSRRRKDRIVPIAKLSEIPFGVTPYPLDNLVIIRDDRGVAAMSLVCSHQKCQLKPLTDSFKCPCHGSMFNLNGEPQQGPATKPLTFYALLNQEGTLAVNLSDVVTSDWRLVV
jgi:Rieske Fe-S protein